MMHLNQIVLPVTCTDQRVVSNKIPLRGKLVRMMHVDTTTLIVYVIRGRTDRSPRVRGDHTGCRDR